MKQETGKMKRRQELKKYLVFALMFLVFAACIWLIFAPSEADKKEQEQREGFNTELPDPRNAGIVEDKMTAYEQETMRRRQEEKMRSLEEFSAAENTSRTGTANEAPSGEPALTDELSAETLSGNAQVRGSSRNNSFSSSHSAYRRMNETLGNFYEQPREDPEKEALKEEVERLRQAASEQQQQPSYAEQVALLEKSYELAAKYMPANGNTAGEKTAEQTEERNGKMKAFPVGQVSVPVVSSLAQPVSDSLLLAQLCGSRNRGFHTPVGQGGTAGRNTISACVHGDQTIISGQSVRMRLLEPMRVGGHILPRNALLTGEARIQGERLNVSVMQVEYGGNILPVELTVYDNDGQPGIFIPGSMEAGAVKEVAANLGQNLGTTISITNQSAGDQLLSELGKGAIQGASQYISKKMRQEKVHLKSGYTLMLYQNKY